MTPCDKDYSDSRIYLSNKLGSGTNFILSSAILKNHTSGITIVLKGMTVSPSILFVWGFFWGGANYYEQLFILCFLQPSEITSLVMVATVLNSNLYSFLSKSIQQFYLRPTVTLSLARGISTLYSQSSAP